MNVIHALSWLILACGVCFAAALLLLARRDPSAVKAEPGSFPLIGLSQLLLYFLAALGMPDYVMNTLLLRQTHLADDRRLPSTLVTAAMLPGAVIAFAYLRGGSAIDTRTLLLCLCAMAAGSFCGAHVMTGLKGGTIRRIMLTAMIGSTAALLVKMLLAGMQPGEAAALSLPRLCIALPVIFCLGFFNMFGVPMKPAAAALFLLLGLSPLCTLTLVLSMGFIGPMSGCIQVLRAGLYRRKVALASVSFGTAGAIAGVLLTVSLNASLLNGILLLVMVLSVISLAFRK